MAKGAGGGGEAMKWHELKKEQEKPLKYKLNKYYVGGNNGYN